MAKELESLPDQQPSVSCSNRIEKHLRNEFHVYFLGTVKISNKGKGLLRANTMDSIFLWHDGSSPCRETPYTRWNTQSVLVEEESKQIVMGELTVSWKPGSIHIN